MVRPADRGRQALSCHEMGDGRLLHIADGLFICGLAHAFRGAGEQQHRDLLSGLPYDGLDPSCGFSTLLAGIETITTKRRQEAELRVVTERLSLERH